MVKRPVIKTFSGYSEDTTIASLVLSLLKEKLECVYEVSQAGLLYLAVPAHALFPRKIAVV